MKRLIVAITAGMMVFTGAASAIAGCCKAEAAQCPMAKDTVQCPASKTACSEKSDANGPKAQKGCPMAEAKASESKTSCCPSKTAQKKVQRASVKGAEHLNTL